MSVLDAETLTALSKELDERIRERRERIATAVLAGFADRPGRGSAEAALLAIQWADALIAELDK